MRLRRNAMAISTVGLLSPGDMGHSIGNVLRHGGLRVITCLKGRSSRSAALAKEAGIEDVADDQTLVREADVLLSVLPPDQALKNAERVAAAVRATGADLLFADCNAISPNTARHAGEFVELAEYGLDIRVMGDQVGQASGIKMCYASLTKGLTALGTELLTAG